MSLDTADKIFLAVGLIDFWRDISLDWCVSEAGLYEDGSDAELF